MWLSVRCTEISLYYCWQVGHKNVFVIRNSEVSVVQGLLYQELDWQEAVSNLEDAQLFVEDTVE